MMALVYDRVDERQVGMDWKPWLPCLMGTIGQSTSADYCSFRNAPLKVWAFFFAHGTFTVHPIDATKKITPHRYRRKVSQPFFEIINF
jgi:hypothetical protein